MNTTANIREIEQFASLADRWWDESGPMKPLHRIMPARMAIIKRWIEASGKKIENLKILDIGCGGGLTCEPLARLGAKVTGLDAAPENVNAAAAHAAQSGLNITYVPALAEDYLLKHAGEFDVVLALEVVEHVAHRDMFVRMLPEFLRPDGLVIMSTLNRTAKSLALGKVAAEYILRWVPRGTHNWKKFIRPSEMTRALNACGMHVHDMCGLVFDPLAEKGFRLSASDMDVNYFITAKRV